VVHVLYSFSPSRHPPTTKPQIFLTFAPHIMLNNWLKPIPKTLVDEAAKCPEGSVGRTLALYHKELPDLKRSKLAIVGLDEQAANAVRKALYRFAAPYNSIGVVADLGNIRKADTAQIMSVVYELVTGKVVPLLIGGSGHDAARAQFLAYQEAKAVVNWTAIDETFRLGSDGLPLTDLGHPMLFHYALVGAQAHLLPASVLQALDRRHFEVLRLGRTRTALEEAEPILRDADLLTFHLQALKHCEAPGVAGPSVSGFFLEEACQLARYAGMSDKLTSFGLFGLDMAHDPQGLTAQAAAQILWYCTDGVLNRKGDYPASLKGLTEYVVDIASLNYQITFWKSAASGRWWLQVPVDTKRKHLRHRLIPCSYQDYQAACRQELPDRFFKAFKRF
jgi:formiminoglutamase